MQREKSTDRLVRGIDVFDYSGQIIYSTDRARVGQKVPSTWTQSAERIEGRSAAGFLRKHQ